jgi:four helix bundle protein
MSRAVHAAMAVSHYRDLIAWQLADELKREIVRLLRTSRAASGNIRYRDQLLDAAASVVSNLVEGFLRYSPGEFRKFIDYSLASLGEAETRLGDGILFGYFSEAECATAFRLAKRCLTASVRLKHSQRYFQKPKPKRRRKPRRNPS